MGITGESIVNRRIKTNSARLIDGGFIDAGTASILSSNLAHLQLESIRHIVSSLGPGAVTNGERGYTNLNDVTDPGAYLSHQFISWSKGVAIRFGSFFSICDRENGDTTLRPRKLRLNFDATGSALTIGACVTLPGYLPDETNLAFDSVSASSGRAIYSLTLEPSTSGAVSVPCRQANTEGASNVFAQFFDLWVGWYSASGTSALISITCNEVR